MIEEVKLSKLEGEMPYDLLLLADESITAINRYIDQCEVYRVERKEETLGILAIQYLSERSVEIKNIAVRAEFQQQGIGKQCIDWLKDRCVQNGVEEILVGTGDASIGQLLFYQKCGFEVDSIRKSFFLNNYESPIYENGVQLKHMIVLKMELSG